MEKYIKRVSRKSIKTSYTGRHIRNRLRFNKNVLNLSFNVPNQKAIRIFKHISYNKNNQRKQIATL